MKLHSREHYELFAMFEREFSHRCLDKKDKSLWTEGCIYHDEITNELFLAYRRGYAFRTALAY